MIRDDIIVMKKFQERYEERDGCWIWIGPFSAGFPAINLDGKQHRVRSLVTPGFKRHRNVVMPQCKNPRECVNPSHMRVMKIRDADARYNWSNAGGGPGRGAVNRNKTHCLRGHEFTPENTYSSKSRPRERICRACAATKHRGKGGER